MKNKLWEVFVSALLLARNKLRGKRTADKKLVEIILMLNQAVKTIDNLTVDEDGATKIRSMNQLFQECLEKYEKGVLRYGDYDPLTDRRNLFEEAQEKLLDAVNYLAMALIKIRATRENAKEEDADPVFYDTAELIQKLSDENSSDEQMQAQA